MTRDSHFLLGWYQMVGADVDRLVFKSEIGIGADERKGSQQLLALSL